LRRYAPTFRYYVRNPFDRPTEEVAPAVRLLGHLRFESERPYIAALANDRDQHVRVAVAEALEPRLLDYQRLIRAYVDHWDEVPKPIDPRVLGAVRQSMTAPKDKVSSTEYHKKLLDLASHPTPPK